MYASILRLRHIHSIYIIQVSLQDSVEQDNYEALSQCSYTSY